MLRETWRRPWRAFRARGQTLSHVEVRLTGGKERVPPEFQPGTYIGEVEIGSTSFHLDMKKTVTVTLIGTTLFTRHAFAFEATSILILVAMVGAVVIARKER